MSRILFRKIKGRIVPIKITNTADKFAEASSMVKSKYRQLKAVLPDGTSIAKMNIEIPKKGVHAEVNSVIVEKDFRRKGISSKLFEQAVNFLSRIGRKYLRSYDIQHPAQVKIRKSVGIYKVAGKRKSRSRFFADQFGIYGEETRRVMSKDAIEILKENRSPRSTGRLVTGTTMIKLKKKR